MWVIIPMYLLLMAIWVYVVRKDRHRFIGEGHTHQIAGMLTVRVPGCVRYAVFYPARMPKSGDLQPRAVSAFHNGGVASYLFGHARMSTHFLCGNFSKGITLWITWIIVHVIAYLSPLWWYSTVPYLYEDAPIAAFDGDQQQKAGYDVLLFSHGLTGTSEEHAHMFADFARRGIVVVAMTHQDGSAIRANTESGDTLWYEFPNIGNEYNLEFRPVQIQQRVREVGSIRQHLVKGLSPSMLRHINLTQFVMSGFSYGAATAALESVRNPKFYKGLVLWDGWYHIDLGFLRKFSKFSQAPEEKLQILFPPGVHQTGLNHKSLFIGSAHFGKLPNLAKSTNSLKEKTSPPPRSITIPNSTHTEFVDLPFWAPVSILQRGDAIDGVDKLIAIRDETLAFLQDLS